MARLAETGTHKIFQVERRGRALVVRPHGDVPGFGHADFRVERERIMSLLENGRDDLIVDFGDANYFGSEMIGVVHRMIGVVRERGGRHAVVNVSPDMREGLAIMRLVESWNLLDERRALREVARESPLVVATRLLRPVLLLLAAAALVGGAYFAYKAMERRQDRADYESIRDAWEDLQRRQSEFDFEIAAWKQSQRADLEPLLERLEKTASVRERARLRILFAARSLHRLLDPLVRSVDPSIEVRFLREMETARQIIAKRDGVEMVPLRNAHGTILPQKGTSPPAPSESGDPVPDAEPDPHAADPPVADPDSANPDPDSADPHGADSEAGDAGDSAEGSAPVPVEPGTDPAARPSAEEPEANPGEPRAD